LNDKNNKNKFKNNKKKLKSITLTFVTGDSGHEFKTNPIKVKKKAKNFKKKRKNNINL
jgi:hypothetical protein